MFGTQLYRDLNMSALGRKADISDWLAEVGDFLGGLAVRPRLG
jgi:hypothetical protein